MAFYLLIAALSFLMLYFAIKKYTLKIDEKTLLEPIKTDIYPKFCDYIDEKIRELKCKVQNNELKLLDLDKKDNFLEYLGDLSRELTFIQTMNLSKKSDELWQNELFNFLKKLEQIIEDFLKESHSINEKLRNDLMQNFETLKEGN
ncbi:hypothetical protein JG676_02415 [Campylobacter sp. 2018MI35]|uniref:hypothetical protein n=1 Tax=Campylobacter sp. 2018MI34 TaxID=2800582 RepID=UPI0019042C37|nr:hypothetical protein [Campylobacter sp. 2018MI34]MBK1991456.1 hypothetical protein [Campylobacter sp. 2018MI34]